MSAAVILMAYGSPDRLDDVPAYYADIRGGRPMDLGDHAAFRRKEVRVPLVKGRNCVRITLSNTRGSNHGGWAFAFKATGPDGCVLLPKAE